MPCRLRLYELQDELAVTASLLVVIVGVAEHIELEFAKTYL